MAKKEKRDPYSEEVIKQKRTLPTSSIILIIIFIFIQIACILVAIFYTPKPQDRIDSYELTLEPQADGSLDIEYSFVWTPLDESEDLTWIEIGMANHNFGFYKNSFSSNISSYEKYTEGEYVSARLYLDRAYEGGETLSFSFRINQRDLLCQGDNGYFYEFVPGWFNSTPVEHYSFVWKGDMTPTSANTELTKEGYPLWEGSMPCGTYVKMQLNYGTDAFADPQTVKYERFYDGDVSDELFGEKVAIIVIMSFICVMLFASQVYMIDSVVSYHRGRGFLRGYGYHIHIYGRTNPRYEQEKESHASHSGTRSGGGCACACACACAGGGRAGCSQKDTHPFPLAD